MAEDDRRLVRGYRETIRGLGEVEYRHARQFGGRGVYAKVRLRVEPLVRGSGFEFVHLARAAEIPEEFWPAIKEGVQRATEEGVAIGCPVVDVRVTVLSGDYHEIDSSPMSFRIASDIAFKLAVKQGGPLLLEPMARLSVRVATFRAASVTEALRDWGAGPVDVMVGEWSARVQLRVPELLLEEYLACLQDVLPPWARIDVEREEYAEMDSIEAERVGTAAAEFWRNFWEEKGRRREQEHRQHCETMRRQSRKAAQRYRQVDGLPWARR